MSATAGHVPDIIGHMSKNVKASNVLYLCPILAIGLAILSLLMNRWEQFAICLGLGLLTTRPALKANSWIHSRFHRTWLSAALYPLPLFLYMSVVHAIFTKQYAEGLVSFLVVMMGLAVLFYLRRKKFS